MNTVNEVEVTDVKDVKVETVSVTPIVKTKKAKKVKVAKETPVVETPVVETPIVKEPKVTIDLTQISLPEGVSVKVNKNSNLYSKDTKRLVILGVKNIYFNTGIYDLDARLNILSPEEIKKAHLGSMKAKLSGIKDTNDFQTLVNNYFA